MEIIACSSPRKIQISQNLTPRSSSQHFEVSYKRRKHWRYQSFYPVGFNCHLAGITRNSVSWLFSGYSPSQRSPSLSIPEEFVYLQDITTQNVFPLARLTWTDTFFSWPMVCLSKQSGSEALLSSKTKLYLIQVSRTLFWGLRNKLFLYAIPNVSFQNYGKT